MAPAIPICAMRRASLTACSIGPPVGKARTAIAKSTVHAFHEQVAGFDHVAVSRDKLVHLAISSIRAGLPDKPIRNLAELSLRLPPTQGCWQMETEAGSCGLITYKQLRG